MPIAESLLPEFDMETAATRRVLALVPDAHADWKPHPKSFSLGDLALHLNNLGFWATMTLTRDELDLASPEMGADRRPSFTGTADVLARWDASVADARAHLAASSDDALHATWTLKYGARTMFAMPRLAVLRTSVMNHMIHHRGQMTVYLRQLDVPLPDLYGPTADTKQG